jgi:hypothetical protein
LHVEYIRYLHIKAIVPTPCLLKSEMFYILKKNLFCALELFTLSLLRFEIKTEKDEHDIMDVKLCVQNENVDK